MKKAFVILFLLSAQINAQPLFSDKGHPEHFIAGTVISGVTSYYIFKKTDNKWKAWFIGAGTAGVLGLLKEVIDPLWFNNKRSFNDFKYTTLGAVVGASIVIPLRKKKQKVKPNFETAFNAPSIITKSY
ncbi:MAG: hypothetical protein CSA39_03865 [Flavobacteriales bacterium]|nr:MAG: hypothetical protein CSA39_03865 [Flavobacteriales bacterium]